MKAICTMDVSDSIYGIGTTNTNLNENTITLNIILPFNVNSAYLHITGIDGSATTTSSLTINNNEASYVLPTSYYYAGNGTISVKVMGVGFESTPINLLVNGTFSNLYNVFVETSGSNFIIKKVNTSDDGGSNDYLHLAHKPLLSTSSTTSLEAEIGETIVGTVNLHKISKTGSYSDLIGKPNVPTKTSDLTNDSGFITNAVNNLVNYYKKSDTYTKAQVNDLIADFITSTVAATGGYGGYYVTSDGFLVQWGAAAIYTTANVNTKATIYYPIAYQSPYRPVVFANPFTSVMSTQVKGCVISESYYNYFIIDILRTNAVSTTVGYVSIGKKGA